MGQFDRNDLELIWSDDTYEGRKDELLRLMINFELCYPVPDNSDTFIAPQLLDVEQPSYSWPNDDYSTLRFVYNDFMPKGILSRFIVSQHQLIEKQDLVWRTGVILKLGDARAEVVENPSERNISIRVSGKNRKDLLLIITRAFDKIHNSFPRLKYIKLIPCNCRVCNNRAEKHFFQFDMLLRFSADGQKIQCPNSYQLINPNRLIENFKTETSLLDDEVIKRTELEQKSDITVTYNSTVNNIGAILKDVEARDVDIEDLAVKNNKKANGDQREIAPEKKQLAKSEKSVADQEASASEKTQSQKDNKNIETNQSTKPYIVSDEAEKIFRQLQKIWGNRDSDNTKR